MKKIRNIIENIILVILIILVVFIAIIFIQTKVSPDKIPNLFGYQLFIVWSSSMEKEIYVGDLVIIKNIEVNKLKVNDIVAYKDSSGYVVTHRIVKVKKEYGTLKSVTKGDNNNIEDSELVSSKDIEGIYVRKLSGMGNVILTMQEKSTLIITLIVVIVGGILFIIVDNSKLYIDERKELEEYRRNKSHINIE